MNITILGHDIEIIGLDDNYEYGAENDSFISDINTEIIENGQDSGTVTIDGKNYDWKIIEFINGNLIKFFEGLGFSQDDLKNKILNGNEESVKEMLSRLKLRNFSNFANNLSNLEENGE